MSNVISNPLEKNLTVDHKNVKRVCALCRDATPTFTDEAGEATCDPCTWAKTAPYYVSRGNIELDGTGGGALRVGEVEYYIVQRSSGRKVGSRKKMMSAYDLCGYWNRNHKLPDEDGEEEVE